VDTFILKSILDCLFQDISYEIRCDAEVKYMQKYIDRVNHELRTPITCIQTAIEVIKRNSDLSEKEKKKIHQIIEKNIDRLIKVIDILFMV
jgi:K+-sensing histidine kinase KdpD